MKTKLIRQATLALATISSLLLASCQSSSSHCPQAAVSCDKCRTVHFLAPATEPGAGGKGIVTLKDSTAMVCPQCENKAIAMLKSGTMTKHNCASCGGSLHHCTQH